MHAFARDPQETCGIHSSKRQNMTHAPYGFGPERRLRSHANFVVAQGTGKRVQGRSFLFLVHDRQDDAVARLGIVASRKLGTAPIRNRIKRVCREAFRLAPALIPSGIDLVVIPRRQAAELAMAEVCAEFQAALAHLAKRS
jgi:ribonuclease P protein component